MSTFSNSTSQHLGREDGDFKNPCEGVNPEEPELSARGNLVGVSTSFRLVLNA